MRPHPYSLSVIVPVFNERENLPELLNRLNATFSALDAEHIEVIIVDDSSRDNSFDVIKSLSSEHAEINGIRLQKNVGSQQALLCGLAHIRGNVVISMDADLQHPPEYIPEMLEAWSKGADIVEMARDRAPKNGIFNTLCAKLFYSLLNSLETTPAPSEYCDFRLLDSYCVNQITNLSSRTGFLRQAVYNLSRTRHELTFSIAPRYSGKSRYTLTRLISIGLEAIALKAPPHCDVVEVVKIPIPTIESRA